MSDDPKLDVDEEMLFDLTEQVWNFKVREKDGTATKYQLREASEEVVAKWRNKSMEKAKVQGSRGGKSVNVQMGEVGEGDAFLVSQCVFHRGGPDDGHSVGFQTVLKWPSRVVKPLYKRLMEMSDLSLDEGEEKN